MRLPAPVVAAGLALGLTTATVAQVRLAPALRGLETHMRVPEDNPLTPGRAALGRRLFFDPALSRDGTLSCATCHDPARGFADDKTVAVGIGGRRGTRNAPSLVNRGWGETFFWDGRVASLEAQVLEPIRNPVELGTSVPDVVARLRADGRYAGEFRTVFGRPPDAAALAHALATYVRSIRSGDSPVDRYRDGDRTALSAEARLGLRVFGIRGLCTTCHAGPTFTDERFHNTGIAWDGRRFTDRGREAITGRPEDLGRFRTPPLREVAHTAPYMHDGSLATLEDVVEFYDRGGRPNPNLDSEIMPLGLSAQEKAGLVAFLRALAGTVVEGR